MGKLKLTVTILFMLSIAFLSTAQAQNAQDVDVLVTPTEIELDIDESVQCEAFAFRINSATDRTPESIDQITWSVEPDSFGTITDDGFFIAGRHVGEATITVTCVVGDRTIVKIIVVKIIRRIQHFFNIEVVPGKAIVPPGGERRFKVVVRTTNDREPRDVPPQFVKWEVRPDDLGKINEEGLFVAGENQGRGKVIAFVELDGIRLRAAADVAVSPPATGVIAGNVSSDAGNPIEGAVVKAFRLGRIHWNAKTETDSSGNYELNELIPGIYVVASYARGFVGEFYDDTRNYREATPLNIAEDDTANGINFGLSEGATIAGTVLTDPDSAALSDAHVVAFLVVNPRFAKHTITDADGNYEIGSLPSGTYAVRANKAGYRGEFYDDALELSQATFLTVQEPEVRDNIDFALGMASAISGFVVSAVDSTPIPGAHIKVIPAVNTLSDRANDHQPGVREGRTNENGEYVIQVRPGAYYVVAGAEGFNGEIYDNAKDRSEATIVRVEEGVHTTGISFDLAPRSTISGTVADQVTGNPIADAVVEAFKENNVLDAASTHAGFRAKTDSSGNYVIENVPAGKFIVVANARGYLPEFYLEAENKREATMVVVEENSSVAAIDFTLSVGGSISGMVYSDEDSSAIHGAIVRVVAADGNHHRRTKTDEFGAYRVEGLRTGSYYVQVLAEGYFPELYDNARNREDATLVDVISPNDTPGIDFYLEPHQDIQGTIAGKVFSDEDESPIGGAIIIAVSPRHRVPHFTFTGPDGFYRLTNLAEGRYFVYAWADGFIGEFFENARTFQEANPVFVGNNQVAAAVNFGLAMPAQNGIYNVSGRVVSATDNAPIEGVTVQAHFSDEVVVNAVTDANGNYVLQGLEPGDYIIEATGAGYSNAYFGGNNPETAAPVTVGSGEDAAQINLSVEEDNVTSIDPGEESSILPESFDLSQNFPNPFNPETSIKYQLSEATTVTLKIFNLLGQEIFTLVDKNQEAGYYTVKWDGKDAFGRQVASGIYIFQLKAGDTFTMSKRMLMLK